jgi:hypothetical protein
VSDTHVGEVLRCWVKDGVFVLAFVGMVGVIPADLAVHWVASQTLALVGMV